MATPPGVTVNHLTRNYTKANRTAADIVWVVVHDMEMTERADTAEACRNYFQTTTNQASSHYTIDNNSIVECVAVKDVAWCAPGANAIGIHLEHAGFARQTSGEWLDTYGRQMLTRSAALTAWLCDTYRVPKRRLTVAEIQAGKPGIVGHGDLTAARVGGNTHTDPGPNFPWTYYIGLVNSSGGSGGSTPIQQEDSMSAQDVAELKDYIGKLLVAGYTMGSQTFPGIAVVDLDNQARIGRLEALVTALADKQLTAEEVEAALRSVVADTVEVRGDVQIVPKAGPTPEAGA